MNKINQLLIATTILAFAFLAAANAQVSVKNFVGPSVEVGVQATNTKLTLGDKTYFEYDFEVSKNHTDYLAKLSAQYGFSTPINNIVMALGASYTPGTATVNFTGNEHYDEYTRIKHAMSLYVEPAYVLSETTAVFGKLSYNRANSLVNFDNNDPLDEDSIIISGIGIGAGITYFFKTDIFLKAEIESINYGTNKYYPKRYGPYYEAKTQQTNSTISLGVKF